MKTPERRYRLFWRLIPHKIEEDGPEFLADYAVVSFGVGPPQLDPRGRWYTYLEWLEPPIRSENADTVDHRNRH